MRDPKILYELDARPWLTRLGVSSLRDVPDAALDELAARGVDLVWLMGVWQTGPRSLQEAREHPGVAEEYRRVLSDFTDEDVIGSPYAIADYVVSRELGGPDALAALRQRLAARQMRLVLDFVVNHTGLDHPWLAEHPEYFVRGNGGDSFSLGGRGDTTIAHGRDPHYPGWTDTAQLDLSNPALREQLRGTIAAIAAQCDGVRCDMAMLALSEVFAETWNGRVAPMPSELWPELIHAARQRNRPFLFIAEVYWGREAALQSLGFDYVYDKPLYDALLGGNAGEVRAQLTEHDRGKVRFLENHDERRAADAMPYERHRAAAVLAATVPGLFLVYDGQLAGARVKVPIQLRRGPEEPSDMRVATFYRRLLKVIGDPLFRRGSWRLVAAREAWGGNPTTVDFIAYERIDGDRRAWVIVNLASHQSQAYIEFALPGAQPLELRDLLGASSFLREAEDLAQGLYVDLPPFGVHVFEVRVR